MSKTEEIKPWHQQDCDTTKSWQAFCVYLNLGPARSIPKVAKELGKKHDRHLREWSRLHGWVRRCKAYDCENLTARVEARWQDVEIHRQELINQLGPVIGELFHLATDRKHQASVRLAAIRTILDKAGMLDIKEKKIGEDENRVTTFESLYDVATDEEVEELDNVIGRIASRIEDEDGEEAA